MHIVKRIALIGVGAAVAISLVALGTETAQSYMRYNNDARDGTGRCAQCHPGFMDFGPVHGYHSGQNDISTSCGNCHVNTGDNPLLDESGNNANYGCNGCHSGVGLRLHHKNANAPADGDGLFCADCHVDTGLVPLAENTPPPLYGIATVNVTDPCLVAPASGGEDYNGDGKGLDNDGDLAYEADDPNCQGVVIEPRNWSSVKGSFR